MSVVIAQTVRFIPEHPADGTGLLSIGQGQQGNHRQSGGEVSRSLLLG